MLNIPGAWHSLTSKENRPHYNEIAPLAASMDPELSSGAGPKKQKKYALPGRHSETVRESRLLRPSLWSLRSQKSQKMGR